MAKHLFFFVNVAFISIHDTKYKNDEIRNSERILKMACVPIQWIGLSDNVIRVYSEWTFHIERLIECFSFI